MATPKPKYTAVVDFTVGRFRYFAGDPVPAGPALEAALLHGDKFVTVTAGRSKSPDQPADPAPPKE